MRTRIIGFIWRVMTMRFVRLPLEGGLWCLAAMIAWSGYGTLLLANANGSLLVILKKVHGV
jgi:hypothetical protein